MKTVELTKQGQLLKGLDFETLIQLNAVLEDAEDNDYEFDTELETFIKDLNGAVKVRCDELINAEKKVKDLFKEIEDTEEQDINAAKEAVSKLVDRFNGHTVTKDNVECAERLESMSIKDRIIFLNSMLDLEKKYTEDKNYTDCVFNTYLSLWNTINKYLEKDWIDIEDMIDLNYTKFKECKNVIEFTNDVLDGLREGMDCTEDIEQLLIFLSQFTLKEDIYVRELEDLDGLGYIYLETDCESRITDIFRLY